MSPENVAELPVLKNEIHSGNGESSEQSESRDEELDSQNLNPVYLFRQEMRWLLPVETSGHKELAEKIFHGQLALRVLAKIQNSDLLTMEQREMIKQMLEDKRANFLCDQFNRLLTRKKRLRRNGKMLDGVDIKLIEITERYENTVSEILEKVGDVAVGAEDRQMLLQSIICYQVFLAEQGLEAHKKMTEENVRFSYFVAKNSPHEGLPLKCILGAAGEGLMGAVAKYSPLRGEAFTTYAYAPIRREIQIELDRNRWMSLSIPLDIMRQSRGIGREREKLIQLLGREPSREELINYLGKNRGRFIEAYEASQGVVVSLNRLVITNYGVTEFEDLIPGNAQDAQPTNVARARKREVILRVLDDELLTDQEREAVKLRFGLSDEDGRQRTVEEISTELGLKRSRTFQILRQALNKLQCSRELRELLPQASMSGIA